MSARDRIPMCSVQEDELVACAARVLLGPCSGFRQVVRLRGRRSGALPPTPPPMGIAPWNPKLMQSHVECQTRMTPLCRDKRTSNDCLAN